ncbi:LIPH Lipase, partial [Acromyrmex heyeri]
MKKDKTETTVFIHGYQGNNKIPKKIDEYAYCSQNNSVIAILDWSNLINGDVMLLATQCKLGRAENAIRILYQFIVHVSLKTGLDPAGVIFYTDLYKGCEMNPTVAHFTDAFYTTRGALSTVQNVGKLNIYANSGTAPQPGCYLNTLSLIDVHDCSHVKAIKWYANAVRNETKYLARKCEDCMLLFRYKYCQENEQIYFGPHVDTKK